MAEDELQYSSVVFKSNKRDRQKAKHEEVVYANVKGPGISPGKDSHSSRRTYQKVACALGTLCVLLVLAIIVFSVYVATLFQETEKLQSNQTFLLAASHTQTVLNINLSSDNDNLRSDINNLTWTCNLLERQLSSLKAEIQNLTTNNQGLTRLIQVLEQEKENLTEEIIRTQSSELNVSRAQWSIEAYCSQSSIWRRCKNCQDGWESHGASCYVIDNSKKLDEWRSWNEAQDDCIRKSSNLVVIDTNEEGDFVRRHSRDSSEEHGYWIGLRANAGKVKWVDGREFFPDSKSVRPVEGQCVISYRLGFASVSCDEKNRWTCEKKALSVEK